MDDPLSIGLLITLLLLIAMSGFFSASETAFTSANPVRLKILSKTKKSAQVAIKLQDKYEKLISTILIGNNIVNIVATSIATLLFTKWLGQDLGVTVSTVVLTVAVLIFGEITPKTLAKAIPEKTAMFTVYPLFALYYILLPFNYIFEAFGKLLKIIFRLDKKKNTYSEEEFTMLVSDITAEGVLEQAEHDVIQNTIKSDDREAQTIMTPIDDVEYIKSSEKIENVMESFKTYNYSRLPVKREEKFIGILYQKDFYEALLEDNREWQELIRDALFIRPNMRIFSLFKFMQKEHQHMAIVVDKNKMPLGIVTMEDIVEEVFGEIEDEYDDERDEIDAPLEEEAKGKDE